MENELPLTRVPWEDLSRLRFIREQLQKTLVETEVKLKEARIQEQKALTSAAEFLLTAERYEEAIQMCNAALEIRPVIYKGREVLHRVKYKAEIKLGIIQVEIDL